MPMMDLLALDVSVLPTDLIDRKLLAETHIVPLVKRANRLSVLLSDPTDHAAIDRVKFQQQSSIDAVVVEHDKLRKLLDKLGQSAADKLSDMVGDALDIEMTADDPVATLRRQLRSRRRAGRQVPAEGADGCDPGGRLGHPLRAL